MNKIFWMISEERSGSTWLINQFFNLYKDYLYLEEINSIDECINTDIVYITHNFSLLQEIINYKQPFFLLRTVRRDLLQQFCSYNFMQRSKNLDFWKMPNTFKNSHSNKNFEEALKLNSKITATKKEFDDFISLKLERQNLWNKYLPHFSYSSQTIYYEDLYKGVDINEFNLINLNFEKNDHVIKLNYDKTSIFVNYYEIQEWVNDVKGMF